MSNRSQIVASTAILGLFAMACHADDPFSTEEVVPEVASSTVVGCEATGITDSEGTLLDAMLVNESVVNETIDLASSGCDIAVFFDENAPSDAVVSNTTIHYTPTNNADGTGVYNSGANVDVDGSTFVTAADGQFVPVRFDEGGTGTISKNEITGTHRVGILIRGVETEVSVTGNRIAGSGAKSSGWAENGIQVDQGAVAEIKNNILEAHWWDGESNFGSTAILAFSPTSVEVVNNTLVDNEFSIYVVGDGNRVSSNSTASEIVSTSSHEFQAYGLLLAGSDNQISGNRFSAVDGAVGLYIFAGSEDNRATGNRFSGFEAPVVDGGDETIIKGKPVPVL